MDKFNLIDEKWMTCIDLKGNYVELGLHELIRSAHHLKRFAHAYPIVNVSYLFLLQSILLSAYSKQKIDLTNVDDWHDLFDVGSFDQSIFDNYFQEWHSRFYLFDEQFPFFQDPEWDANVIGTAMKLMPHYSGGTGGNTATLFDHHTEEEGIEFSEKQAANFLLPAYYYGAGGRIIGSDYFSDAPTANALSFFIGGNNLFETLILNLLPYPEVSDVAITVQDCPIWEQEEPFSTGSRKFVKDGKNDLYRPYGLMDILTWPGRKLKLIRDEDHQIRMIQMHSGLKMHQSYFPWFAYSRSGNYVRVNENKALWRNFDVLIQMRKLVVGESKNRPPQAIDWIYEVTQSDYFEDRNFDLYAMGMAKKAGKQKTSFYCDQMLPLPTHYLKQPDLIGDISSALDQAESVSKALYGASSAIATGMLSFDNDKPNGRMVDPKDKKNLISHLGAERIFWGALEPHFYSLITQLPQDRNSSLIEWKKAIRNAAWDSLEHAIRLAGQSVQSMKAAVKARAVLGKGINEHLGVFDKEIEYE